MKKNLSTIFLLLVLVAGVALLLYPTASDYWNSFHQSRAIAGYSESVATLSSVDYERFWLEAVVYNEALRAKPEPFLVSEEEWAEYIQRLNISGNGIMGYIEIPKIECVLPIYHGTDESVLQIAVGHIEGSTLPVGGASSHCVLSGHRGLPSAKLFSDLDRMEVGDIFMLQVLNETLSYQVDQIHIVLPQEMDDLAIEEGRDYCTLVTCTPYGINTHRLLVRGHRVENQESAAAVRVSADAMRVDPILVAPAAAVPMLLLASIWMMFSGSGKKRKKRKRSNVRATERQDSQQ
ncbi:MAG: class C sortase [Lawsonibacter sp.]|nr:class C sortase [Lawsonibacter sp.]